MKLLLTCAAEEGNTYLLVQPKFDKNETAVVMPSFAHSLGGQVSLHVCNKLILLHTPYIRDVCGERPIFKDV